MQNAGLRQSAQDSRATIFGGDICRFSPKYRALVTNKINARSSIGLPIVSGNASSGGKGNGGIALFECRYKFLEGCQGDFIELNHIHPSIGKGPGVIYCFYFNGNFFLLKSLLQVGQLLDQTLHTSQEN